MRGFRGNSTNEKKLDLLNLHGKIINNMPNKIAPPPLNLEKFLDQRMCVFDH